MLGALLLIALLISYGSLYPFDFTRPSDLSAQPWEGLSISTSRTDLIGNIALFLPYGFFAALAGKSRGGFYRPGRLVLSVFGGVLLAISLQWAQLFLPARVPALYDALLNLLGITAGLVIGMVSSSRRLRGRLPLAFSGMEFSAPILIALFWVAYRLFPFVPSLDLGVIKDSLKPLLVYPEISVISVFDNALRWALFFLLLSLGLRRRLPKFFFLLAPATLFVEVLIIDNAVTMGNLVGTLLGVLVFVASTPQTQLRWLTPLVFLSVLLKGLYPFEFSETLNDFSWLPFSGFLRGSMWTNSEVLLEKLFLYGAMILMLRATRISWVGAGLATAIWLLIVECLQLFVYRHNSEITDPLLAILILFTIRQLESHQSPSQPRRYKRQKI